MPSNQASITAKPYTKWNDDEDEHFIIFLSEQVKLGTWQNGSLSTPGWNNVTKEMSNLYGNKFDKSKLKNRMRTIKKIYSIMKRMINHSGFGWNEDSRKVEAEPDVWEQYLKAHPKDSLYQTKKLPDYNMLASIFGDTIADGKNGCKINDEEDYIELSDDDITHGLEETPPEKNDNGEQNIDLNDELGEGDNRIDKQVASTYRPKRNRASVGSNLTKAVERMTTIAEEQMKKQNEAKIGSAEKMMPLIMELELPPEWLLKAINILMDERKA